LWLAAASAVGSTGKNMFLRLSEEEEEEEGEL
jgi:hypothetical protein